MRTIYTHCIPYIHCILDCYTLGRISLNEMSSMKHIDNWPVTFLPTDFWDVLFARPRFLVTSCELVKEITRSGIHLENVDNMESNIDVHTYE